MSVKIKPKVEVLQPLEWAPSLWFCCDGASVMSGHRGGVQVLLKETFSKAVYLHCNSHRLNLVLCTAAKAPGHVSTFFDIVNQIHNFFYGAQSSWRYKRCIQTVSAPQNLGRSIRRKKLNGLRVEFNFSNHMQL